MQPKDYTGTTRRQQYIHLLHTTENQESWNMSATYVNLIVYIMIQLLFQKNLVQFLQEKISKVDKILYFSDGSAAQYKNQKNFVNLCYHKEDFGVQAEWHFYATSHGKGPCDGIGGTVKCLAARASLQRAYHSQIMTPCQLLDLAVENIEKVHFKYCTSDDYRQE